MFTGGTLTLNGDVTYDATGNPLASTIDGSGTGGTAIIDMGAVTRTFAINDSTKVTGSASELTISGKIGGSAGLTNRAGQIAPEPDRTYAGVTTVSAGMLAIGNATRSGRWVRGMARWCPRAVRWNCRAVSRLAPEALSLSGTGSANNGALRNLSGTNTYGGVIRLHPRR